MAQCHDDDCRRACSEICRQKARYRRFVGTKNWDGFAAVLADDIYVVMSNPEG